MSGNMAERIDPQKIPYISDNDYEGAKAVYEHQRRTGYKALNHTRAIIDRDNSNLIPLVRRVLIKEGYTPKEVEVGLKGAMAAVWAMGRASGGIGESLDEPAQYERALRTLGANIPEDEIQITTRDLEANLHEISRGVSNRVDLLESEFEKVRDERDSLRRYVETLEAKLTERDLGYFEEDEEGCPDFTSCDERDPDNY